MIYVTFLPLGDGSSYILTPKFIAKKRAIVNVKSHGTDCFRWAVLAALYPVRRNANRLSSYVRHRDARTHACTRTHTHCDFFTSKTQTDRQTDRQLQYRRQQSIAIMRERTHARARARARTHAHTHAHCNFLLRKLRQTDRQTDSCNIVDSSQLQ